MRKKHISYIMIATLLCSPLTVMAATTQSALVSSDCGASGSAAAKYAEERMKIASQQAAAVSEGVNKAAEENTFNMLDCLSAVTGDLFSFANIDVLGLLKNALLALAAKACQYTRTTTDQYLQQALDAASFTLPYNLGTVGARGTTVGGQTVNSGLTTSSAGSSSLSSKIPGTKVSTGNAMFTVNP